MSFGTAVGEKRVGWAVVNKLAKIKPSLFGTDGNFGVGRVGVKQFYLDGFPIPPWSW